MNIKYKKEIFFKKVYNEKNKYQPNHKSLKENRKNQNKSLKTHYSEV